MVEALSDAPSSSLAVLTFWAATILYLCLVIPHELSKTFIVLPGVFGVPLFYQGASTNGPFLNLFIPRCPCHDTFLFPANSSRFESLLNDCYKIVWWRNRRRCRLLRTPDFIFWLGFSGVGKLVVDLSGKDRALACLSAGYRKSLYMRNTH